MDRALPESGAAPAGGVAEAMEPNAQSVERREWPRVRLSLQVRLRFASADAVVQSQTFDLSEGGAFVRLPQPRPVGTQVRLVLDVADRTVAISGTVVRLSERPPGIGIAFAAVEPRDRNFVSELVRAQARFRDTG